MEVEFEVPMWHLDGDKCWGVGLPFETQAIWARDGYSGVISIEIFFLNSVEWVEWVTPE